MGNPDPHFDQGLILSKDRDLLWLQVQGTVADGSLLVRMAAGGFAHCSLNVHSAHRTSDTTRMETGFR